MITDEMLKCNEVQIIQPDVTGLQHITDFDSYHERLSEAEQDYNDACADFLAADPNKESIMAAAELAEKAGKELIARASVAFHMFPADPNEKKYARDLIEKITKDANKRERTCCQLYRKLKQEHPECKELLKRMLEEKQKRMTFLDRCMMTQSHYDKKLMTDKDRVDPIHEMEVRQAAKAARTRKCIPAGHMYLPPRIFPHDPIPVGQPVPVPPDVYRRVEQMEGCEKVYDLEHDNFVLAKDYLSEDGLVDGESVVWDYVNNKVTMKYRGGVAVTWDFWKPRDTFDNLTPDHWCVQYYQRLVDQELWDEIPGLFKRRHQDEEVPEYNKIPDQNKK